MKKILAIVFASLLTLSSLAACNNNKDNAETESVYHAEYKNADSYGYIPFVELTVDADGKITDATFDWKKSDDDDYRKSADEEYAKSWRDVNSDIDQNVVIDSLIDQLLEKQDVNKVDSVAGATSASDQFTDLITQLTEERIDKNNTKPLVIDNATE